MNKVVSLFFSSPATIHVECLLGPNGPQKATDPTLRFSTHFSQWK